MKNDFNYQSQIPVTNSWNSSCDNIWIKEYVDQMEFNGKKPVVRLKRYKDDNYYDLTDDMIAWIKKNKMVKINHIILGNYVAFTFRNIKDAIAFKLHWA